MQRNMVSKSLIWGGHASRRPFVLSFLIGRSRHLYGPLPLLCRRANALKQRPAEDDEEDVSLGAALSEAAPAIPDEPQVKRCFDYLCSNRERSPCCWGLHACACVH